jgi:NTP pyrophosphatase (non-canonical NTP hydrolase)
MDKYSETKTIVNNMAKVKMAMNAHKGNIEDAYVGDIIKMLTDEIGELVGALDKGDFVSILQEIADAQNFLTAIAHQQIAKYRIRKK